MNAADVEDYILAHTDPEPEVLYALRRQTHLRTIQPRMVSGHAQGALLTMLARLTAPRLALEVGTFTGYSAIALAMGMTTEGAVLHTVEIDDEREDFIRSYISRAKLSDRIVLHIGDVRNVVDQIVGQFDLMFVDGDKREYPAYYNLLLPRLRHGGLLLVDNVLWDGHVLDANVRPSDHHTQAVKEFNDMVAADTRVEKIILPMRDGLMLVRKK